MKDGVIIVHKTTGMGYTECRRLVGKMVKVDDCYALIECDMLETRSVTRFPDLPQVDLQPLSKPNQKWYHQFDKKRRF